MICSAVQKLIEYAQISGLITEDDVCVARNGLLSVLCLVEWTENDGHYQGESIDDILEPSL